MRRIFLGLIALSTISIAQAMQPPGPLVETQWLANNLDEITVLSLRADLKSYSTKPAYIKKKKTGKLYLRRVAGHIPGGLLVDYNKVRSVREIDGRKITRLVPPEAQFEKFMQQVGLNKDDTVVIVTRGQGVDDVTMATRLYWQLKHYGHDKLAILDGGLSKWLIERREVSADAKKPKPGNWVATSVRDDINATSEEVARVVEDNSAQLLDTRSLGLYLGTWHKSYVKYPGHIPGAKVFPNELLSDPGKPSKFTSKDKIQALAKELGIEPNEEMITYCNSGHLASGGWFVMSELLGNKNVKLYDGSMHQWTTEGRPTTKFKMELKN